jgi:ATP-dependent RNA helicase DDX3X
MESSTRVEPIATFAEAGLHPAMIDNIKLAGYTVPTPIQVYTIPSILSGHDMIASAQTGSGKTAAYLIPILSKLMGKADKLCGPRLNNDNFSSGVRAEPLVLILSPTRELAIQIFDEARRFCYRSKLRPSVVYGGPRVSIQTAELRKGCDVLIGTSGRLKDILENHSSSLSLNRLRYTVMDEADELLTEGWEEDLKAIMTHSGKCS